MPLMETVPGRVFDPSQVEMEEPLFVKTQCVAVPAETCNVFRAKLSRLVLVGLIFGGAENKKYIEAVEIYNQGLRRSNKVVDLNFGFTQSGIGLSLTF